MPSVSKAQRRLFGAAEHGANFPMAQKLRATMSHQQLHDFAATKEKGLPGHVSSPHPHRNLKGYLHPPKGGLGARMRGLRAAGAFTSPVPRGTRSR